MSVIQAPRPSGAQGAAPRPGRPIARRPRRGTPAGTAGWVATTVRQRPPLETYLRSQRINVVRHAAALRPFRVDEFGTGPQAPSRGHVEASNRLITAMGRQVALTVRSVERATEAARREPTPARLQHMVTRQEAAHDAVRVTEQAWDFFLEMFGQRQSAYGPLLLGCDRVALDCYRQAWLGLGTFRPVPAPPPFCYMRTGFSPATWRRMIPLRRLGMALNPYPVVQLPYHRIVNPWTLGAMLHETSHNLQDDLGLAKAAPAAVDASLADHGVPVSVRAVWARWHREVYADLSGLLLGGPSIVASLIDILSRSPRSVSQWNPRAAHPLPLLRPYLSTELLRRMGFPEQARDFDQVWGSVYAGLRHHIPDTFRRHFGETHRIVVDALCYSPQQALGGRSLSQVQAFGPVQQEMVEQCGRRLGKGTDPGVIPERFLIGAARHALDHKLARPDVVAGAFYTELARR